MKKITGIALSLALTTALSMSASADMAVTVNSASILVDGETVEMVAYNIDGNNYFKLRDIAYALDGSEKQFDLEWIAENSTISIETGDSYTAVGGEHEIPDLDAEIAVSASTAAISLDGTPASSSAYNISGNNYYKLRDIGELLDFGVVWDDTAKSILIDTTAEYVPETTTETQVADAQSIELIGHENWISKGMEIGGELYGAESLGAVITIDFDFVNKQLTYAVDGVVANTGDYYIDETEFINVSYPDGSVDRMVVYEGKLVVAGADETTVILFDVAE